MGQSAVGALEVENEDKKSKHNSPKRRKKRSSSNDLRKPPMHLLMDGFRTPQFHEKTPFGVKQERNVRREVGNRSNISANPEGGQAERFVFWEGIL